MKRLRQYSEMASCHACPLCLTRTNVTMPLAPSPVANRVMVLLNRATRGEDAAGVVMADAARAKVVSGVLKQAGLDSSAVYITNRIKCRLKHEADEQDTTCHSWLLLELCANRPLMVITFGDDATTLMCSEYVAADHKTKILQTRSEIVSTYPNPVLRKLFKDKSPLLHRSRFKYDSPQLQWQGPAVLPVIDPIEAKAKGRSSSVRRTIKKQIANIAECFEIMKALPPTWTSAVIAHKEV